MIQTQHAREMTSRDANEQGFIEDGQVVGRGS